MSANFLSDAGSKSILVMAPSVYFSFSKCSPLRQAQKTKTKNIAFEWNGAAILRSIEAEHSINK